MHKLQPLSLKYKVSLKYKGCVLSAVASKGICAVSSLQYLSLCTSPLQTAYVFNPTRPEYYRQDSNTDATAAASSVRITLSDQAQAALKTTQSGM